MGQIKLPYLNCVILTGVLAKDPEYALNEDKISQVNFMLAVGRRYRDYLGEWHEEKNYIRVVAFQKLAELCKIYLLKGSSVLIEGELQSRVEEVEEGDSRLEIEVRASKIQFLGKIKKQEKEQQTEEKDKFAEFEIYDY